jgi:hypothetical protein
MVGQSHIDSVVYTFKNTDGNMDTATLSITVIDLNAFTRGGLEQNLTYNTRSDLHPGLQFVTEPGF